MQELFLHGTITTSQAKASAIKGTVDKIINLAKNKTTQRLIQSFFSNKLLQDRVINEIAPKLTGRTSGYTSSMKVRVQEGDRTTLVKMSLIGLEQLKPLEKISRAKESKVVSKELPKKQVAKTIEVKTKILKSTKKATTKSTKK